MGSWQRWRHSRHAKQLTSAAVAMAVAMTFTVAPTAAQAAPPPQEPGVTLRVFDVQTALSELCTLKAGQTPNVDKLMSTINWTTATDFGFEDNFVAQVLGNVNITTAGSYTFRLTSDDGSRLLIDDTLVINHDGLHGATAKDGTITLTTGYHALRIDHFERGGGQQITLEWRTPGSTAFVARAELGAEHRRRRGAGDRAGPQGVRGRRRLARRRPAADRRAPQLHPDQPAAQRLPAAGHRHGLAARRPPGHLAPGAAPTNPARRRPGGLHPGQHRRQPARQR